MNRRVQRKTHADVCANALPRQRSCRLRRVSIVVASSVTSCLPRRLDATASFVLGEPVARGAARECESARKVGGERNLVL